MALSRLFIPCFSSVSVSDPKKSLPVVLFGVGEESVGSGAAAESCLGEFVGGSGAVLFVPLAWKSLHVFTKHSPELWDCLHIIGWNIVQFLPSLQPCFPLFPWSASVLHILGCLNLHPLPAAPYLQIPLL